MKKILLVEDDTFLADIYLTKFEEAGYDIKLADNGEEGIKSAKQFKPDVLLLDIVLPKMNGLKVLSTLKKDSELKNIKVIILSNLGAEEDINRAMELGADTYLIKSQYTPSEIVAEVEKVTK